MNYHNITKCDILNGDGVRVVLWVAGCSHHCKGCHNSITWDKNGGLPFDICAETELFDALSHDYIDGITLSGGDPLFEGNRVEIERLLGEIKSRCPQKNVWLYTGYCFEEIKDLHLLKYVDVLVDGKFEIDKLDKNLLWKGSLNQRVIDVKKSLNSGKIILHCKNYLNDFCLEQ